MFAALRSRWRAFKQGQPGRRFEDRYRRKRPAGWMRRWLGLAAGIVLCLLGLVMMVAPGPGILALAVGAALLAEQSLAMARLLDRAELALRRLLRR